MHTKSFIIYLRIFIIILLNTLSIDGVGQDKAGNEDLFANEKKYSIPNYIVLNDTSRVSELLYEGPDYKEKTTEVFAYYSNPDLLRGKKAFGKKYPGIVLLHGGGGSAFKEWVELWAAEGFAAIAMDMSGSGKNRIPLSNAGPKGDTQDKFNDIENGPTHTWSYHSVCSIIKAHSLLRSFPEVDTTNTFITGISWGGYLTCMVAGIDNRYKAAAPVYGCGYFNLMEGPRKRLNALPEMKKIPNGVQVGNDVLVFKGNQPDSEGITEVVSISRSGKEILSLSGNEIDLERWQGEVGLFVPDAGYPFGDIPEWLAKQRAGKPDWAAQLP